MKVLGHYSANSVVKAELLTSAFTFLAAFPEPPPRSLALVLMAFGDPCWRHMRLLSDTGKGQLSVTLSSSVVLPGWVPRSAQALFLCVSVCLSHLPLMGSRVLQKRNTVNKEPRLKNLA